MSTEPGTAQLLQAVRVSVNAVLVAGSNEATPTTTSTAGSRTQPAATAPDGNIQRLLTGGGLFNVSFALPVVYFVAPSTGMDVMLLASPRFGVTAPVLAATGVDSSMVSADVGMELHAKALDIAHGVGVVMQVRWANAHGSRDFIKGLGITGQSVTYVTSSFGFLFGSQYLLTASKALGGPKIITQQPWQIGLTVVKLPN